MILRSYALDGNMLTWDKWVFGKTSLGNESSYNAGYAVVNYVARKYGEQKLKEISRNLSTLTEVTIDGAINRALGRTRQQVYDEWQQEVKKDYAGRSAPVREIFVKARRLLRTQGGEQGPAEIKPTRRLARRHDARCRQGSMFSGFFPLRAPDLQTCIPLFSRRKETGIRERKRCRLTSASPLSRLRLRKRRVETPPQVRTHSAGRRTAREFTTADRARDNPHWNLQFDIYRTHLIKMMRSALPPDCEPFLPRYHPAAHRSSS